VFYASPGPNFPRVFFGSRNGKSVGSALKSKHIKIGFPASNLSSMILCIYLKISLGQLTFPITSNFESLVVRILFFFNIFCRYKGARICKPLRSSGINFLNSASRCRVFSSRFFASVHPGQDSKYWSKLLIQLCLFILPILRVWVYSEWAEQWGQCIWFSVVFTPPPHLNHYDSVWHLPVIYLPVLFTIAGADYPNNCLVVAEFSHFFCFFVVTKKFRRKKWSSLESQL